MIVFFSLVLIAAILLLPIFGIAWIVLRIMKKDTWKIKLFFFSAFCIALISLAGVWAFSCNHQWSTANCLEPKTCLRCEITEGALGSHQWEGGTCTSAAVCALCQETEPEPSGHRWVDATCERAQYCTLCEEETGEVLSCEYKDGICTYCGESGESAESEASVENEASGELVWIPQTGEKYHSDPACSNMIDPTEVTRSKAIEDGFEACSKCY